MDAEYQQCIEMSMQDQYARDLLQVEYTTQLIPYCIDTNDDKIILPDQCVYELSNALTQQPFITFRLESNGNITHCGVREFTAPEGCVGIPTKVWLSMGGDVDIVTITLVTLEKCTFIRLTTLIKGSDEPTCIKEYLEDYLQFHTTISINDVLPIDNHVWQVVDILPNPYCQLIDTDVEIEFVASETVSVVASETGSETGNEVATAMGAIFTEYVLPDEPTEGYITVKIKAKRGTDKRRFTTNHCVQDLFRWIANVTKSNDITIQNAITNQILDLSEMSATLGQIGIQSNQVLIVV